MSEPHVQFETRHLLAYAGAWWTRWGLGMIVSRGDDGYGFNASLLFGPFYLGLGWQA